MLFVQGLRDHLAKRVSHCPVLQHTLNVEIEFARHGYASCFNPGSAEGGAVAEVARRETRDAAGQAVLIDLDGFAASLG